METTDTGRPASGAPARPCPILGCSRVTRRSVPFGESAVKNRWLAGWQPPSWSTALAESFSPMGRDERVGHPPDGVLRWSPLRPGFAGTDSASPGRCCPPGES